MQRGNNQPINQFIINNFLWFLASFALAFVIWVIASNQADPIDVRPFNNIPIQVMHDDALLIVDQSRSTVQVSVRAQESVRALLLVDDITVTADLTGFGPGTHTVELDASVSRRATVDTSPAQITVTLEQRQARRVPVRAEILVSPPLPYSADAPQFGQTEAEISGPASLVEQVVAAQVELDLARQTANFEDDVRLVPVDVEGDAVQGVTIAPQVVNVTVPVRQRNDVTRVSIAPDIGADTLPEGYTMVDFDYEPRNLFVSGDIEGFPTELNTEFISLAGQTSSYVVTVPVVLPDGVNEDDILFLGERNVTVTIEIAAQLDTVQFDDVPVSIIGLGEGLNVQVAPEQVSVQITGPVVVLSDITAGDVSVVIDLNGLQPGSYPDLSPLASVGQPDMVITTLPDTLAVTITGEPTPEATPPLNP